MGDEADERVGTSERPPGKVALRLWVADQAFLRRDGDSGLYCVYRVPAGMDAWDERPDHGRAGVGPIHSKADFAKYHGKLKGKALLMFDPAPLTLHTLADAQPSPTDEEILARGGARGGGGGGRGAAAAGGAGAPSNPATDRDPSGRG